MNTTDNLTSRLLKAIAKVGTNGTGPSTAQDPVNALLHEYFVSDYCEKVFKRRKEQALKDIHESDPAIETRINKAVEATKKQDVKQDVMLASSADYVFNLSTKKGSSNFKREAVIAYLRKIGWSATQVDTLIEACTSQNEPAKSYSVSLRTEQE